jgi:hypothetical protein
VHYFDNNTNYARGYDWYAQQMPQSHPTDIVIEKTPAYFVSPLAPQRVHMFNPHIRLVLIIREPVERTISDYSQVHDNKLSRNKTHAAFERLIFNEHTGRLNLDYKPIRNSLYAKHLQRWLRLFPLASIHIVDGDQFVLHPLDELRKVEQFLGLKSHISAQQLEFNATKGFYCFKRLLHLPAKCLGSSKGRRHVNIDERSKQRLQSLLQPYNVQFFNLINRTFNWTSL